jgi:hypothetical protein
MTYPFTHGGRQIQFSSSTRGSSLLETTSNHSKITKNLIQKDEQSHHAPHRVPVRIEACHGVGMSWASPIFKTCFNRFDPTKYEINGIITSDRL